MDNAGEDWSRLTTMGRVRIVVTLPRDGAEQHLVVEGPPSTTRAQVLAAAGVPVPGGGGVAEALEQPVQHGDDLGRPGIPPGADAPPWLVVAEGPDAGAVVPLPPGRWITVGRDPGCDLPIEDPALSRRHARVRLGRHGVRVEDLGSTNGVTWESGADEDSWPEGDRLRLGRSALVLVARAPAPARTTPTEGFAEVVPWPCRREEVTEVRLQRPTVPQPRRVRPPSAWTWALPLGVAVVVAVVLRMPWLLMFGLLGPAMVLGHHLSDRRAAREEHSEACAARVVAVEEVERSARSALGEELRRRRRTDEGVEGVARALSCTRAVSTSVWSDLEGPVRLVVGSGELPSRVSVDGEPLRHRSAPVVVTLDSPVAVVGPPVLREGLMRSLLLQLATRHPPTRVRLAVGPRPAAPHGSDLTDLMAWLPHCVPGTDAADPGQTVLVWGRDLMLVEDVSTVPTGCTVIFVTAPSRANVIGPEGTEQECVPTMVGRGTARRAVRRLAPLRERAALPGADRVAHETSGVATGTWPEDPADVIRGWGRPGTDVVIGTDPGGAPSRLDLVTDGPHALVAGTTGSGKSELLRTLVTSLALRCSPADLALLLVDYKGGSSLGDCALLPHVTGLVTDLDPHLAERVLLSLQAELTRRESVLRDAGARDIGEYTGPALPRLVVVVDEFRVLAEEVPDVLTRLVRLAAVGRSLGVHLVLATQRPAGVVSADLRANVNLRIALRVRDQADSHDVLDCADAAELPEGRPGLALVRTGADRPRQVQVSRIRRPEERRGLPDTLVVRAHTDVWAATAAMDDADPGGTDDDGAVAHLVSLTVEAARQASLRPPVVWLPPLPGTLAHTDTDPGAWAVLDRPEQQRREDAVWTADRHLGLVGSARSGRSTAVRSLLTRLVGVWVVVLDLGHGLEDSPLRTSPACCAWVGPDETAHGLRVLELLQDEVRRRQTRQAQGADPLVVVIDGWDRLVDQYGEVERGRGVETALRVLREGPAVGVVALMTGDRSLLVGRLATLLPETWALPLNDPSDLLLTGLRSTQVPPGRPPGRIVGVRDGVVGQVVLPDPGRAPSAPTGQEPPLRCVALPSHLDLGAATWAVGGDLAEPVPAPHGDLLVLGPAGSGRSWTLSLLAALRPGRCLQVDGADPPDLERLRRTLATFPDARTVAVDDAHLLTGTPVEDVLLDHAGRTGAALLVAADLDTAAGTFRGLVPAAGRARSAVVLQPASPAQGAVVGVQLPVGDVAVPGRGVLVHRGRCTRLQVVSPPGSP